MFICKCQRIYINVLCSECTININNIPLWLRFGFSLLGNMKSEALKLGSVYLKNGQNHDFPSSFFSSHSFVLNGFIIFTREAIYQRTRNQVKSNQPLRLNKMKRFVRSRTGYKTEKCKRYDDSQNSCNEPFDKFNAIGILTL